MQVSLLSYGELASLPSYTRGTRKYRQVLHLRTCGLFKNPFLELYVHIHPLLTPPACLG
jgi:hypothetical protein